MTELRAGATGRIRALRILAVVMAVSAIGFGLFTLVLGIVNPAQEPHAFHNAVVASLLLILSAPPVVAIAWAPERPIRPLVILAVVAVAALATMAVSLTLDPFTLPFVLLIGVLWALVPSRSGALPEGRPSLILLALSLATAVVLVPYALEQAGLQRTDHASEHAAFFHWVEMSFYATGIPLLGVLAAVRPVAYRPAAWASGVALAVMGVASLMFPQHASALPAPWGLAAVVAGVLYIILAWAEARRITSSPEDAWTVV
jgi:hypothetical protein